MDSPLWPGAKNIRHDTEGGVNATIVNPQGNNGSAKPYRAFIGWASDLLNEARRA